jgi:hypothetical protein
MGKDEEKWKAGQYNHHGTGSRVMVAFAGQGVKVPGAAAWAKALYEQKLKGFDVGHVYSVIVSDKHKLPAELVPHFQALVGDTTPVYVIAHSSGSGVAHHFLRELDKAILDQTTYFNVDGGHNKGAEAFKTAPKKILAVYAESTKGGYPSRNAGAMDDFGFKAIVRKVKLPVPNDLLPKKDAGKDEREEQLQTVKDYLHHRLIVKDPPFDPKNHFMYTEKEYVDLGKNPKDVVTDWIDDKDKDL